MSGPANVTPELVAKKNAQRAALRKEYLRQVTNPHHEINKGNVFDPAIQRFNAMFYNRIEHFRQTPKTTLVGMVYLVVPLAATIYLIKTDRDTKEANYRAGNVAYKDRLYKFI